jgi:hypothetical protein
MLRSIFNVIGRYLLKIRITIKYIIARAEFTAMSSVMNDTTNKTAMEYDTTNDVAVNLQVYLFFVIVFCFVVINVLI